MKTFQEACKETKLGDSELLLRNVFIRSAAYEGMHDQGIPNQALKDHMEDLQTNASSCFCD